MDKPRTSHEEINRRLAVSLMDALTLSDEDKLAIESFTEVGGGKMKKYKKIKRAHRRNIYKLRGKSKNIPLLDKGVSFEEGMKMCRREETKKKVGWATKENTPEPCLTVFDCQ